MVECIWKRSATTSYADRTQRAFASLLWKRGAAPFREVASTQARDQRAPALPVAVRRGNVVVSEARPLTSEDGVPDSGRGPST